MAITIEGFTVVAQRERIQELLDRECVSIPNSTALADDDLWRCSFMTHCDATEFVQTLNRLGLNTTTGPDSDVVLVNEIDRSIDPYCEWLLTATWEKAVIAWLAGTEPQKVVAREGWDPKVGSGLVFQDSLDKKRFELLRVEGTIEVYRDKEAEKEVYVGNTSLPLQSTFELATRIILSHFRTVGESPVKGKDAEHVRQAIEMLNKVIAEVADEWRVHWFHGKGHLALGNLPDAYASFQRAYDLEKQEQVIARELAGTCLELGKFEQAVEVAEHGVALHPDNHELIGNLALAHLLAGHVEAARRSITAALKINSRDQINRRLYTVIEEVATGKRLAPKSVAELQSASKPKKFWQFWKK